MKRTLASLCLLAACGWLTAQQPGTTTPVVPPGGGAVLTDADFVLMAASGGMLEVKSSELAKKMATSADVKKHADQMIADHTKANKELMALAAKKGMTVPPGMTKEHADMLVMLSQAQGQAFDTAYITGQVKSHEKSVALFKTESTSGQDADLKAWAGKTLPTLEMHLKHAQAIAAGKTGGH